MKLYISGPMRRKPGFNFKAFDEADALLKEIGHETFNPAARDRLHGFDLSTFKGDEDLSVLGFDLRGALTEDLTWICQQAEAVVLLKGWEWSRGAKAEVATAEALGIPCWTVGAFLFQHHPDLERKVCDECGYVAFPHEPMASASRSGETRYFCHNEVRSCYNFRRGRYFPDPVEEPYVWNGKPMFRPRKL